MKEYRKEFEMFKKLTVFKQRYPKYFEEGTLAGQSMAQIESNVEKLSEHDTTLQGGDLAVKVSFSDKKSVRTELRAHMETISRLARGLQLPQISMPRDRTDAVMVSIATLWGQEKALVQTFLENGLTDLLHKLNDLVAKMKQVNFDETSNKGLRTAAASAIKQTRADTLAALRRLDPLMKHLLRDDPAAAAFWDRTRRVERSSGPKKPADASVPPVDDAATASA